jgi:high-affinity iron transporter
MRRSLCSAGLILVAGAHALGAQSPAIESARRVVATVQLAAIEYKLAFQGGRLVNAAEWDEAKLFVGEALSSARQLPAELSGDLVRQLTHLAARVEARFPADSLAIAANAIERQLSRALGVSFDERPAREPSLAIGERIFERQCSSCHGLSGTGDGPAGRELDPPPSDLTDAALLATATPLDFYRKITHGVPGTGMPAFDGKLSREERWDAVAFAFALTDSLSRDARNGRLAVVFGTIRGMLGSALEIARGGDGAAAASRVLDAYMEFERIEAALGATNPSLVNRAEQRFTALRITSAGGNPELAERAHAEVLAVLEQAQVALLAGRSPVGLFVESLLLMLREGFEAILVIGAIMAVLARAGARRRMRNVRWGIGAALVASLATAGAIQWVFRVSPAQQEALEGAVMLLAAATLFYVSYWLISKVEVAAWTRFVKDRIQRAVESGSAMALAGVAFLAVYREGFETVLFYKALFVSAGAGGAAPIGLGMALGAAALVAVYIGIEKFGLRVPIRPFFAVTGAMLSYMAFVFAGQGIAELQAGGYVGLTPVAWAPRVPYLGIYPTVQSLSVQAAIVLAVLVALVWTFAFQPRRIAARAAAEARLAAAGAAAEEAAAV